VFFACPTGYISSPNKAVILSEALRRSIANRGLNGAQSKDPEGAFLTHAARSFSTTEAHTWRPRHGLSQGREPFSRVPMSLRLTQGDENQGEVVFDSAVTGSGPSPRALPAEERDTLYEGHGFRRAENASSATRLQPLRYAFGDTGKGEIVLAASKQFSTQTTREAYLRG
jgi:hypothetical protein